MLPYLVSGAIPDVTNAFFETMSGMTTTGEMSGTQVPPESQTAASFSRHMSTNLTVAAASKLESRAADFGRGKLGCILAMPTCTLESMKGVGFEGNNVLRMSFDVGTEM